MINFIDILIYLCNFIFIIILIFILTHIIKKLSIPKIMGENHIKIIDKQYISKESYILIIKIGSIGKVVLVNKNNSLIIQEIDDKEIKKIIQEKEKKQLDICDLYNKIIKNKWNLNKKGNKL